MAQRGCVILPRTRRGSLEADNSLLRRPRRMARTVSYLHDKSRQRNELARNGRHVTSTRKGCCSLLATEKVEGHVTDCRRAERFAQSRATVFIWKQGLSGFQDGPEQCTCLCNGREAAAWARMGWDWIRDDGVRREVTGSRSSTAGILE